jgi:hypothetical protein
MVSVAFSARAWMHMYVVNFLADRQSELKNGLPCAAVDCTTGTIASSVWPRDRDGGLASGLMHVRMCNLFGARITVIICWLIHKSIILLAIIYF